MESKDESVEYWQSRYGLLRDWIHENVGKEDLIDAEEWVVEEMDKKWKP